MQDAENSAKTVLAQVTPIDRVEKGRAENTRRNHARLIDRLAYDVKET